MGEENVTVKFDSSAYLRDCWLIPPGMAKEPPDKFALLSPALVKPDTVKFTPPRLPDAVPRLAEFHAAKTVPAEARQQAKARRTIKQGIELHKFNRRKFIALRVAFYLAIGKT
jgi:hypothetical protein